MREVNPADRREILVRLTPAGAALRDEVVERLRAADRLLAQHIDADDLDRLRRIVARLDRAGRGLALLVMPWVLGFSDDATARTFYLAAGLVILVVWALTAYQDRAARTAV